MTTRLIVLKSMTYDREGRQAFSRDGNRYGRDRRAFALYDALGRVAVTGTCQDDAPEVLLEASMDVASSTYSSGSFAYDANGNQTCDLSRDITNMEYNALNLPCRATFADGSHINWLYTASGEKLRQTVIATSGDTISRRDYLGPYLFVNNEFDRYETAEGYITPDDAFHAYIPDYQGNIVGVYNTAPDAITHVDSPLDQHTRYYPYGLPFADAYSPTANRRKYGAKELTPDLGLNAYDFEARTLTPAFPMFSQQDPMAEKYPNKTPYNYCSNNPINRIDPNGMADYYSDTNGKYLGTDGNDETSSVLRLISPENFKSYSSNISSLETNSQIITIKEDKIQSDIQTVRDLSLKQGMENQMYIYLDKKEAEVSSIIVTDSDNKNTSAPVEYYPAETAGVNYATGEYPRCKIIIGQLHGHPSIKDLRMKTLPGMSEDDKQTAKIMQIPVYAVDAMEGTGAIGNSVSIHMVNPSGKKHTNIGKTIGNPIKKKAKTINIGKQALEIWGRSGRPAF
ncbi:MAG: RHS repeat domain-containing protein [Muribaculaceae bacterium]